MPEWFEVIILGLIEGITEFLPISSTGHMLLAENWLTHKQSELFLAVIQCGAVLAVLMVFTDRVKQLLLRWREPENQQYIAKLAAAFLLTAIGGLALKKLHFSLPKDPMPIALATLIGGILIVFIEMAIDRQLAGGDRDWRGSASGGDFSGCIAIGNDHSHGDGFGNRSPSCDGVLISIGHSYSACRRGERGVPRDPAS
jgi:undecaprenyl-diphosphatase